MDAKLEQLNMTAMSIIMDAGDARELAFAALDLAATADFAAAHEKLSEAHSKLKSAHGHQTETIQSEIAGESFPPSLLFNHAQDTLMTVGSELEMSHKLVAVMQLYEKRLATLEEGMLP